MKDTQFLAKKLFYFIPDISNELLKIKEDYVIATEFDTKDITFKVRFLNGDAVQMFAVGETKEDVEKAHAEFLQYRKSYLEAVERIKPVEDDLHKAYESHYADWMSKELLNEINDRHNVNKVVEKAEEKAANENAAR